ncbi:MAG: hypothetical protein GY906_27025 [bacterium]|nr:hypothetical protein [bacterium]
MPYLPRTSLTVAVFCLFGLPAMVMSATGAHVNPSVVLSGCSACHVGHGVSRSPMLGDPVAELCLKCHGSQADVAQQVASGELAGDARPPLLASVFAKPHVHPIDNDAVTRFAPGAVTCTSCHSAHRSNVQGRSAVVSIGRPHLSPRDPTRFEFELCESCHGDAGAVAPTLTDISRLLTPENRSYHPVEAPSAESSHSIVPALRGAQINCTDCHGNSDPGEAAGPHASDVAFILRANYTLTDGGVSPAVDYALCFRCHEIEAVLNDSPFSDHGRHIREENASCATCHNPHGSVNNRALVRFGEETRISGVLPSASTGRLAFISDGPGSGACFLTCHGVDHGPSAYGSMKGMFEILTPVGTTLSPIGRLPSPG